MPQHESSALGLLQVQGRASPRITTVGERAALSAHPTNANCDVEWIPHVSRISDSAGPSTPRCPTLAFSRPGSPAAAHSIAACRPRRSPRSPSPSFFASNFSGIARSYVSPPSAAPPSCCGNVACPLGFFWP